MPRSFRFEPPEPRAELLTRPRLLRALLGRWDHRVVAMVGGPGLGKTTLLAQAVAENLLAPRGEDVWVGIEPGDADGESLARAVAAAVAVGSGPAGSEPGGSRDDRRPATSGPAATGSGRGPRGGLVAPQVADAVWRRSPAAVCLVFDDVHLLAAGSPGARWLAELVEALPANGHVLMASRSDPPLPLARLRAQNDLHLVTEDDLRFSDDEVAGFAARRGLSTDALVETGGWPAMAELTATALAAERHLPGAYVWEEVLEPLGPARRRILAAVSDLGGADDELAAAALGTEVDLRTALDGVPLVAAADDGWRVPHLLWRTVAALVLPAAEGAEIRRRAVHHLVGRARFEDAFGLVAETQLWDLAPVVLRGACVAADRPTAGQLERWLDACPEDVRTAPAGLLAAGLRAAFVTPAAAVEPLQAAVAASQDVGDVDAELAALAELGRIAWWSQNRAALGAVAPRVADLARDGYPTAQGLAAFGRAGLADVMGDDAAVLAALDSIETGVLDAGWEASTRWLRARIVLSAGDADAALTIIDDTDPGSDPVLRSIFSALRMGAWWSLGRIDDVLARLPRTLDGQASAGVEHNRRLSVLTAVTMLAHVGRREEAQRFLDTLGPPLVVDGRLDEDQGVLAAVVAAGLQLAAGDEAAAATLLDKAVARHGLEGGTDRRTWRANLALTYVLVPEARRHWDDADLAGAVAAQRQLAQLVVKLRAARAGTGDGQLQTVDIPAVSVIRAALPVRFAVELAAALSASGRPEGVALLDAAGPPGRDALRDLGADPQWADSARSLLAAVPAPPAEVTDLTVLGPMVMSRDGTEVTDPDLRRERVRTMLAFLVGHRRTSRAALQAALWPDLDERAAANNLRVTLNYLLRVLEPWRPAGEPSYLVRLDGTRVELVAGDHLRIDVDQFDQHVAAAAQAERDGTPSLALDHHLAAADLYRGDLHADLADADWVDLDREHYRSRFVIAAVRGAQLLIGRGDVDQAEVTAQRALAVDPWAEDAFGVLVAAALARGDRSAARRQLDRGQAALAEIGLEPSDATRRLRRRVRGGGD